MNCVIRVMLLLSLNFVLVFSCYATVYYVDPVNGKDTNNGKSVELAFQNITKAISTFKSGDTTYLRGGAYSISTTISIGSSMDGTSARRYNLFAYPGDARPVLDFTSMEVSSSNRGIYLRGDYWYVKGIDIKGAGDNGMNISGSNNIIENCAFYENKDTGLQLSGGASYNKIINCDSYFNSDPDQGDADGFAPKLDVGSGNYFYGCRSWQNSDDGWDGYMRISVGADTCTTILENCWCFKNGYLKTGQASSGNGNGYKMGGSDDKNLRHNFILRNCIAFDNRVKGFDQNSNQGSMTLLNCTAYRNGLNYGMNSSISSGSTMTIKNCISFLSSISILSSAAQEKNSWLPPFSVTEADFMSLDPTACYGQRNPDGSLPDIEFLHLTYASKLIDAGIDVGIPFNGNAPDLGAFEYETASSLASSEIHPETVKLYQNYPNPFNPHTVISYKLSVTSFVRLIVYDILGNKVVTLINELQSPGFFSYTFSIENYKLASGVYFYSLTTGTNSEVKKMHVLK